MKYVRVEEHLGIPETSPDILIALLDISVGYYGEDSPRWDGRTIRGMINRKLILCRRSHKGPTVYATESQRILPRGHALLDMAALGYQGALAHRLERLASHAERFSRANTRKRATVRAAAAYARKHQITEPQVRTPAPRSAWPTARPPTRTAAARRAPRR